MVWLVHTKREHTQKLKRNLRNFRCEGKLIKTECCKLALTEISSKPNGNACYASYASGDMIFLIFGWVKFHVFLWMVFNQQLQKGEKKNCHDHYIHRDWNVENSTLSPTGRALGRALSCLELMRTRAPPVERLSYRTCDSVNFLFRDVRVFRRFWAFLQLKR